MYSTETWRRAYQPYIEPLTRPKIWSKTGLPPIAPPVAPISDVRTRSQTMVDQNLSAGSPGTPISGVRTRSQTQADQNLPPRSPATPSSDLRTSSQRKPKGSSLTAFNYKYCKFCFINQLQEIGLGQPNTIRPASPNMDVLRTRGAAQFKAKQCLDRPKIPIVRPAGNQSVQASCQQNPIVRPAVNPSLHPPGQQFLFVRALAPFRPPGLIPRRYRPPDAYMLRPANYVWEKRLVVTREALLASFTNNSNRFLKQVMSKESTSSAQGGGTGNNTEE
ncbi:hypothetical protein SESBI_18477 [Sesbania bispinosa]|nr:hypothetical protein SESBI_18477 [Sesbania bispinosa]